MSLSRLLDSVGRCSLIYIISLSQILYVNATEKTHQELNILNRIRTIKRKSNIRKPLGESNSQLCWQPLPHSWSWSMLSVREFVCSFAFPFGFLAQGH